MTLQVDGREIFRDKDGYLRQLADWDREVATALAQEAGIVLTDAHWAVIDVLRGFYAEYRISPATRVLVKAVEAGDELAGRILKDTAEDLAFGLSHVIHLMHPSVVVVGGGLSLMGEPLRNAPREPVRPARE